MVKRSAGFLPIMRSITGWAQTENNLANALSGLGGFEEGIDSLAKAVEHYKQALSAYPVETNPAGYAETQYNIAVTLLDIGMKTGRQEDFDAARAAAKASHDVYLAADQHQYDSYYDNLEQGIQLAEAQWAIKRKQGGGNEQKKKRK
mgnify:FL=1